MRTIYFIRQIFRRFKFYLIINIFALLLLSFIDIAAIFSLVAVIDTFLEQGATTISPITQKITAIMSYLGLPATLYWVVVVFLCFGILRSIVQIFVQFTIFKTKYAVCYDLAVETIKDFLNASWYFFSSGKQGTLLNTFNREMTVVGNAFSAVARYYATLIQIAVFLLIPFYLSWQITSVVLISSIGFAVPLLLFGKISYRLGEKNTSTGNEFNKVMQECLSSVKIILGYSNQNKVIKDLKRTYHAHTQATIKSQTLSTAIHISYYPLGLLVLVIGLFLARKTSLPLSETAVLFYSIARIIPLIGQTASFKNDLDNFFPSYEQILRLRSRARDLKQSSGSKNFTGFKNKITIENISFAYPNNELVLKNVSIQIPKGKMVAIVGDSGSGKSTLLDLIMFFYDPVEGGIFIDSENLREFNAKSYRRCIGYVPQESVLFNMSVKDNLLWSKEDATDTEIKFACQQAYADQFIEQLPQGYDTIVGDRGVRLSGGQVQRITLARAILRNPQLLILDEATSALDTHSERLIQQAIDNIAKKATVIVVAHRLSTIKNAHYVYVLKEGRVVEEGEYSKLTKKEGHFNKMVKLQMLETAKEK